MIREDFDVIAEVIKRELDETVQRQGDTWPLVGVAHGLADDFVERFDAKRFDRARFLTACGF